MSLPHFSAISIDDVIRSTRQLLDKSSAADLLPTYIFKQVIDLLAPFVTDVSSLSFWDQYYNIAPYFCATKCD